MLMPMLAIAAEPAVARVRAETGTTVAGNAFCARINAASGETVGAIGSMRQKLVEKRTQRDTFLTEKKASRVSKVEAITVRQTMHRAELSAKLSAKADTDVKKQAVAAFQAAHEAAVTARTVAVKAANDTFQAGIAAAIANRKISLDAAVTAFQASMKAALDKAKADCAIEGGDPVKIKASYMVSVKAAKEKLMADRKAADKVSDGVKALADAHRVALDKAFADFKLAMEKAKADLKAAFPRTEPASAPTNTKSVQ